MNIDRLLQVTFATLVSLGTLLLGMGQRNLTLPLVAILAAGVSIYVTDLHGWIRLNRPVANLAALLAVVFSVSNFFRVSSEDQLLAVANLLVYLQVVLMFQKKTGRMYWQLLMLNVLQVVVGAALDLDMLFGLLLVVYLFVTLAAMNLLFIQRESDRWRRAANSTVSKPAPAAINVSSSAAPPAAPIRSLGEAAAIRVSAVLPADSAGELLKGGVFRRTLGIGFGTLLVAGVCFFSIPRFGRSLWAGGGTQRTAAVGFSPTVKLGDLGPLLQNPELVMRVKFSNENTHETIIPTAAPLFRGSLVTQYAQGEWKHDLPDTNNPASEPLAAPPSLPRLPLVRQQITLEPMPDPVLFAVYPAFDANTDQPRHILFDIDRQQLVRTSEVQGEKFEYELMTIGFSATGQCRLIPQTTEMDASELARMLELPDDLPQSSRGHGGTPNPNADPAIRLTGLREMAAKTIHDAGLAEDDFYDKAKALERMLGSPPFAYSLDRPPPAPNVDPIEDFVTRNHSGHCEYFASALVLMLRSQGIPARMVIGFHGGERNPLGSFLDVRQLNAHAWVEAYLRRNQIPKNQLSPGISVRNGAWLVLDSTPASGAAADVDEDSWLASFEDLSDYVAQQWNSYIVGLTSDRQRQIVYQPLEQAGGLIKAAWQNVEQSAANLARRIGHGWGSGGTADDQSMPVWPIVLFLTVVIAAAIGIYIFARRLLRRRMKRRGKRAAKGVGREAEVAFYLRFEALLARRGLVRRTGQTQRELAQAAAAVLPDAANGQPAGLLARRIVDAYYRVRFGRVALDSRQAAAVEQLLDQLQTTLARPKRNAGR